MNEFVLVEFIAETDDDHNQILLEISKLGDDFEAVGPEMDYIPVSTYWVFGRIKSSTATFITLQNPFLAERMRISYIPDEMKDKYRNR